MPIRSTVGPARALAGGAVDRLAQQVGVAVVAGVLLDQVARRSSAASRSRFGVTCWSSSEWAATISRLRSHTRGTWRGRASRSASAGTTRSPSGFSFVQ